MSNSQNDTLPRDRGYQRDTGEQAADPDPPRSRSDDPTVVMPVDRTSPVVKRPGYLRREWAKAGGLSGLVLATLPALVWMGWQSVQPGALLAPLLASLAVSALLLLWRWWRRAPLAPELEGVACTLACAAVTPLAAGTMGLALQTGAAITVVLVRHWLSPRSTATARTY